jgi:8-oxo-dGTP diphosphatase
VAEVEIRLHLGDGGLATLTWEGEPDPEALERAVRGAAGDALSGRGLRRIEVALATDDRVGRRALLRAGFRQEGVRREAHPVEGGFADVALFARLAADPVGGPTGFSGVMNSVLPRKRVIAHVLVREGERVLLCETMFKPDWELPGGIVEPLEAPRLGAVREVREELGIDLDVGRLLLADWMPPYLGWDDALELIFDGGTTVDADLPGLALQPAEIRSVRLCTLEQAADLVTPISHRRLSVALDLAPGETAYLENGRRV